MRPPAVLIVGPTAALAATLGPNASARQLLVTAVRAEAQRAPVYS
jgi:hypothetical protein